MLLSKKFVSDYIDLPKELSIKQIADDMTSVGNEYDSAGPLINCTNLIVGKVLECVNHKDSNKANNNIKNLEWCSRTYNIKYGYENGERITIKQLCNEIEELKSRLEKIEANCYRVKEE